MSSHHDKIQPAPQAPTLHSAQLEFDADVKHNAEHLEEVDEKGLQEEIVMDNEAAGYVNHDLVIDEAENQRLRKIVNRRILPLMCLVYLTQALDKGALGPISIMGWLEDVNAKGQDYAMTSTVLYIGIIIGEPIALQLIRRWPVAKILAASMFAWTALSIGLAFSLTIPPVLANRFLLGLFEATFNPCLVTITVQWYKREEQPWVSAIWQSMTALATAISSVMAWGLSQTVYNGPPGLRGWQWMLVVITLVSAFGFAITLWLMPDSPTRARWASDDLKTRFIERVRSNNQGIKQKKWKSDQAWDALKDPYSYSLFGFSFTQTLIVGGIGKFNSLLINKAFGFDVLTSQLLKIPMALCGVMFYYVMAFFIWKFNNTLFAMCGFATVNMIGTIVLITVTPSESTKVGLFIAFVFMQCFSACNTAMFLMMSRNVAGQTKKSIIYATTFIGWGLGNALAPQLFWDSWAPRYIPSLYIHVGLYLCFIANALLTRWMLVVRNKRKVAAQTQADGTVVQKFNHAFEDLTDRQNPDFRYCL